MTVTRFFKHASPVIIVLLLSVVGACRKDTPPDPSEEMQAKVVAKLAKADALDGATDKVVVKCAACALRMDGSVDHTFTHAEYSMHFCSAGCKDRFSKDPVKAILALEVPQG